MFFIKKLAFTTPKLINYLLWLLFLANLSWVFFEVPNLYGAIFKIDGFTILIYALVTFFSALIANYSNNYLNGFKYQTKFALLCFGFTLSIMMFVTSNNILLLLVSWFLMGVFMSKIIGVNSDWQEAKEASKFAFKYFGASSFFLGLGVLLLAFTSNTFTLREIILKTNGLPDYIVILSAIFIIIAALIQSAIFPFHRWLLSAMTAPTPASALMHAGFVNGSGILLALFSTVLFRSNTLILLFVIGGLTAIVAQFIKLIQVNVKQKLACSTIAQMGFMIMQCGLGLFNAAIVHLILHGFYKAYLFLSSGEEVQHTKPKKPLNITIKPLQAVLVLIFGVLGAVLFNVLTGKSLSLNSSVFLTLIVAITVGQITYNIVKEQHLNMLQKIVLPPILFLLGIIAYALIYNGVTILIKDMPLLNNPVPISAIEMIFGIIFLIGFFIMKLGVYKKYPWIYVKLLNASQPNKNTVLMYKS